MRLMENNVNEGGQKSLLNSFLGPNIIGLCFAYVKTCVQIIGFFVCKVRPLFKNKIKEEEYEK